MNMTRSIAVDSLSKFKRHAATDAQNVIVDFVFDYGKALLITNQ